MTGDNLTSVRTRVYSLGVTVHTVEQDQTQQRATFGGERRDTIPAPPPYDCQSDIDQSDEITMPGVQASLLERGSLVDET